MRSLTMVRRIEMKKRIAALFLASLLALGVSSCKSTKI